MRIALLDIKVGTKIGSNFTAVNMRNMILLQKELGADFYYSTDQLINNNKEYDIFIFGFASVNGEIEKQFEFVKKSPNSKIFRLVGEYEQSGHPPLYYVLTRLNKMHHVISNVDENFGSYGKYKSGQSFLNLNLLVVKQSNQLTEKKYDCIYYGRWREDRKEYFKKYIQDGIYLSTSIKNMKKFKHNNCNPKYLDTISWEDKKETLNFFRYSLYIEDKYTHSVFNNLANRWYEAGFCNNVMFFDINCINTIKKSELGYYYDEVKDYIVSNHSELIDKIKYCNEDWNKHLGIQKLWRINEPMLRQNMIEDLKKIIML